MPNWCYNSLTIKGSKEDLGKFIQDVTLPKPDEGGEYDLTLPYPTPKELVETVSGWSADEAVQAEREKQYASNLAKYGYKDWYDWNIAHWGTKWSPRVDSLELDEFADRWSIQGFYDTAWSPATGLMRQLSMMYPTLVFHTTFDEESQAYVGCEIFYQGRVYDAGFEPGGPGLPDGFQERWDAIRTKFQEDDDDAFQDLLDYQSELTEIAEREAEQLFSDDFPSVLA